MAKIILSAQNFDIYEGDGQDPAARTGSISIEIIAKSGAQGVILGHSEVGDSIDVTRNKLLTLLQKRSSNSDLLTYSTILVGETWEEFNGHSQEQIAEIVSTQLISILKDTPKDFVKKLSVGYEPKWGSRGSGHDDSPPPSPKLISACAQAIKSILTKTFGETGKSVSIIYGGRSTPERTEYILKDTNIEGLILGSACNTVQKTIDIAAAMMRTMGKRQKILHANFKAFNLIDSYEIYIKEIKKLDDTFTVYLSPNYTDIRLIRSLL